MDGCGNGVVRRLPHVDMVVRMNWFFATEGPAQIKIGNVCNDFVRIHIGGGAGAGLKNIDRKVGVVFPAGHFQRLFGNDLGQFWIEFFEFCIGESRRPFDEPQCLDEPTREALAAHWKIIDRALGGGTVEHCVGDFDLSHRVGFGAQFHEISPTAILPAWQVLVKIKLRRFYFILTEIAFIW